MKFTERPQILWFGREPESRVAEEFTRRDLGFRRVTNESEIQENLAYSRGLVFHAGTDDDVRLFMEIALMALDHGLLVVPTATEPALKGNLHVKCGGRFLFVKKGKPYPFPGILLNYVSFDSITSKPWELAQLFANWNPGPVADARLDIKPTVPIEDELLFRRAFSGYKKIEVETLNAGRSRAGVYKVYATPVPPITRPLPMYAKIDLLPKIDGELKKYRNFVEPAVPFNLRPDFTLDRYTRGASKGILVGNFVEGSEPLWRVVRRGHGQEAIYSLFDHAFKAWRLCSVEERAVSVIRSLEDAGIWVEQPNYKVQRFLEIIKSEHPSKLLGRLKVLGNRPHRVGIIHGDLHADNICVRRRDAILIDFYSVREKAPLAFDPATLEISLAFRKYEDDQSDHSWLKTIDNLYSPQYFLKPPEPAEEQHPREWLWNTVRQIRMIALASEVSPREYQTVLAYCLIRACKYNPSDEFTAPRRAYGCLMAQRLIHDLESAKA